MDENNVTADIFNHTSNIQIENENTIFTSEKLDKLDELTDASEDSTINNAKYYESKTATASYAQGNSTRDTETAPHTRNRNEKVTHTSNRSFKQKSLNKRTIPVVVPIMNPRTEQRIAPIVVAT